MDYERLATELALPAYGGLSPQEAADTLNAPVIEVGVDVPTADAREILLGTGEWFKVHVLAETPTNDPAGMQMRGAAFIVRETLLHTALLQTSRPENAAAVTQLLGALALPEVGVLSEATRDMLLGMTRGMQSRAEQIGIGPVTDQDVLTVRVTAERAAQNEGQA